MRGRLQHGAQLAPAWPLATADLLAVAHGLLSTAFCAHPNRLCACAALDDASDGRSGRLAPQSRLVRRGVLHHCLSE